MFIRAGLIKEIPVYATDSDIQERTRVVLDEAERRNISVCGLFVGKRPTGNFSFILNGRRRVWERLPALEIGEEVGLTLDNKSAFKKILHKMGAPYPPGRTCWRMKHAMRCSDNLGFPLVVKPISGSLSKHVTTNITSAAQLRAAVHAVRIISCGFIVERHIRGDVYRATCVGGSLVACCKREPPHVVGDGTSSITALLAHKNRSAPHATHLTHVGHTTLQPQGYKPEDAPPKGKRINLHEKVVLACGAEITDVTDIIHSDTKTFLERVAKICAIPL
ncbi:MAG: hypothetical protein Q8R20_02610, partial [Nanoarchaeota archaeon]|nr:hypothetical protein [Nanoarchaeota archaeon]